MELGFGIRQLDFDKHGFGGFIQGLTIARDAAFERRVGQLLDGHFRGNRFIKALRSPEQEPGRALC